MDSDKAHQSKAENQAARDPDAHAALFRLTERHAATESARRRQSHPSAPSPTEVVRLVTLLAAGTAQHENHEEPVGVEDIRDALALMQHARADMDATESSLIDVARGRGLSWAQVGEGLGLGSAQAAHQRYARLMARSDPLGR
jgi:hypothetical protein